MFIDLQTKETSSAPSGAKYAAPNGAIVRIGHVYKDFVPTGLRTEPSLTVRILPRSPSCSRHDQ